MRKEALRSAFERQRSTLSETDRDQKSLQIANRCLSLPIWQKRVFHLFLSIPSKNEIDTSYLLTALQGRDREIVIPKVAGPRSLTHYLLTDATRLQASSWGVPEPVSGLRIEPEELDVIFLPLLAYDTVGNRVGYGGGFYDRFLADCRDDAIKIGLSFFPPVPEITDLHTDDIRMDYCVTPAEVYSF